MNKQTLIEKRIYHLHQKVIQKLQENPQQVIKMALTNLQRHRKRNGDWPCYLDWEKKLSLPVKEIIDILESNEESAIQARSNSPFAGCITPRERWSILRRFNKAHETS